MTTTVHDRQSLFDIAVSTAGSIEAVFDLAGTNNRSITGELEPNTELHLARIINQEVTNHYRVNNLTPATEFNLTEDLLEGIECWYINYDFAVS
jgi:hypothetical protein